MTDWTDPQTFWLNVTNALLGLVTLAAFVTVVGVAAYDLMTRWLKQEDRESAPEPHALHVPALGLTMADGGEKTREKGENRNPPKAPARDTRAAR